MNFLRKILPAVLMLLPAISLSAQNGEDRDSLVTLISAKSAQLIQQENINYRKVIGPAKFLHNNTYLICDTALWNVDEHLIKAMGHVKIIQNRTRLTSDNLDYLIDEDLAKFRGSVVQLEDADHNTLRTRYLDFNTKDSIGVFQDGGAMRDKDGQIIESRYGSYDSKSGVFTFVDDVNMFTDSVFVKTSRLVYESESNLATFGYGTDAWQDDNMLSANAGWYNRSDEVFLFRRNVHMMTKDKESWSDSLYYYRLTGDVTLLGHAEIKDTVQNVSAVAGKIVYCDSLSKVSMTRSPAVITVSEENEKVDTVYFGADTLIYRSIPRCDVDSLEVSQAETRLKNLEGDPITEYRRKAAEEAAKALEEAMKDDPNRPPDVVSKGTDPKGAKEASPKGVSAKESPKGGKDSPKKPSIKDGGKSGPPKLSSDSGTLSKSAPGDSLKAGRDSVTAVTDSLKAFSDSIKSPMDSLLAPMDSLTAPADSISAPADSIDVPAGPKDSTAIGFVQALGKVKMWRSDAQIACNLMLYNDLDSLVRMYLEPKVYNEGNRQYSADSIFVSIKDGSFDKASLMSNAFITTQEDSLLFDQIKGAEMTAYFDSTTTLTRFDALGGATAIFFLEENDALATVNKVESKMLYALFKAGNIDRIHYFEEAKNDAYPVVQMPEEEKKLKGFRWDPDDRPKGKQDVAPFDPRPSERTSYEAREKAKYAQTAIYFPGYMDKIYKEIEKREILNAENRRRREEAREAARLQAESDSLRAAEERLDSLKAEALAEVKDSLSTLSDSASVVVIAGKLDSLARPVKSADSLSVTSGPAAPPTKAELEAAKKAEKEALKAKKEAEKNKRREALEAKWAEKDKAYEDRVAAKEAKKQEKRRATTLKALRKQEKKAEKQHRTLQRYVERYEKKAQRAATRRTEK